MRTLACCGALLAAVLPLSGQTFSFATTNQAALARSFALPMLGRPEVHEAGGQGWRFTLDLTNEFVEQQNAREELVLDGESLRYALEWRAGLAEAIEWSLRVPAQTTGGGQLDSFIERWHDWFGLPNGGRERAPQDRYVYRYVRDGVTVLDHAERGTSLGDIELGAGWRWREGLALRGLLKLPTASDDALGGGNLGGALWGDYRLFDAPGSAWSGFLSAGASLSARADDLAAQQRRLVPFGGAGIGYRLLAALEVGAQLYAHGPLYEDSTLAALDRPGLQLAFGGRYHAAPGVRFDVAIQEDAITRSSPDFSVHVGLHIDR